MSIEISGVNKKFGDFVALEDVSLEVPGGSLTAGSACPDRKSRTCRRRGVEWASCFSTTRRFGT